MIEPFVSRIASIKRDAELSDSRALIWLRGEADWLKTLVQSVSRAPIFNNALVISSSPWEDMTSVSCQQTRRLLGSEFDGIIYDAHSGVNPDSLGHLSGLLKGGGLFFFLTPESQTEFYQDPEKERLRVEPYLVSDVQDSFLSYFWSVLESDPYRFLFTQSQGWIGNQSLLKHDAASVSRRCEEQSAVASELMQFLNEQPSACAVLTAARGRGKSYLLGICARQGWALNQKMAITAPNRDAVTSFYEHPELSDLPFVLPHEVAKLADDVDLLFVDEAAAIPVFLLLRYLQHFKRVVFATTTQGYEGTGQGFNLRFISQLSSLDRPLKKFELHQPIRWSASDSLEPLFNRLLMLDASSKPLSNHWQAQVSYRKVSSRWLIEHPAVLGSLFGLMIDAHYRTTPNDLRIMLDSPNVSIWIGESESEVIAGCILASEGALDDRLSKQIWSGTRRPRGHLIPQLLIAQQGFVEAGALKAKRIVRIAVHHQCRRSAVASRLLQKIEESAQKEGDALVGASFAMTTELLDFWRGVGYQVVRVGTQLDVHSGAYSALVVKPLDKQTQTAIGQWHSFFLQQLPYLKRQWLTCLDQDLVQRIELGPVSNFVRRESDEWNSLSGFAYAYRTYESSAATFASLAKRYIELWDAEDTPVKLRSLIKEQVINQHPYDFKHNPWSLPNEKMLIKSLREAAAFLLSRYQSE